MRGLLVILLLAGGSVCADVVRLRGSLDIESLPTPVRLLAYFSSAWDMDSEWHQWGLSR